jgi:hypothetical protein
MMRDLALSQTKVADLTTEQLQRLIQQSVRNTLLELLDPDLQSEPSFHPEIAARLKRYQQEKPIGIPVEVIIKELGLDDIGGYVVGHRRDAYEE